MTEGCWLKKKIAWGTVPTSCRFGVFDSCVCSLKSGIIRTELMSGVFQDDVKLVLSASDGADIVSYPPPNPLLKFAASPLAPSCVKRISDLFIAEIISAVIFTK